MNAKKSHSLFKLLALALAFFFTVLFIPVGDIVAWALIAEEYVDYSYIKIGEDGKTVETTVYTGDVYYIPKAYIGGNTSYVIGDGQKDVFLKDSGSDNTLQDGDVKLVSSKISVTYGSSRDNEGVENGLTIDVNGATEGNAGSFKASRFGTYTVTYAYTYEIGTENGSQKYTNYYDMKVVSSISEATIELDNNDGNLFPEIIDASLLPKTGETYDDKYLPIPTVYKEDGEEIKDINIVLKGTDVSQGDYLVVSMIGGTGPEDLTADYLVAEDTDEDEKIDSVKLKGSAFNEVGDNYSSYTIKYAYYHDGQFVVSDTKTATVYKSYYKGYSQANLQLELDSSLTESAQPGIEQVLPGVIVTTNDKVNPANEEVEVSYKIKVRFRAVGSSKYVDLDKELYNKDEEIVDENGYLVDPTKFTPLEAGSYTFNYVATDFYGNKIPGENGTADGRYPWTDIKDTTAPTAIVYDASIKDSEGKLTYEEASDKLARYHAYNGVVVYAVGLEDNLTKMENADKADLKRIVLSGSEELFVIEDYDDKNLIFNYRGSQDSSDAYQQLINNNYLISKAVNEYNSLDTTAEKDKVKDNETMLKWLRKNGFLIVIDNGGTSLKEKNVYAKSIYSAFKNVFDGIEGITNEETFLSYVQNADNKDALEDLGFAYISNDKEKTFGAITSDGGFNSSSYQIRYVAKDEAGNSNYISRDMNFTSTYDTTPPTIELSTNFANIYDSEDVVEFEKPTASDDNDTASRMKVQTYYRFLDSNGDSIKTIEDQTEYFDNTAIFSEPGLTETDENGTEFKEKYAKYMGDGYINLTDADLSKYSIDLSLGKDANATSVQIFAFVYDDYGNVGIYGDTFDISSTVDTKSPILWRVEVEENQVVTDENDVQEVTLPTIQVRDDNVDFMSFNVSIYNLRGEDSRFKLTSPSNSTQSREGKTLTAFGGTFEPNYNGEYMAAVEFVDYNNSRLVVFSHYNVQTPERVNTPTVDLSFEELEPVELDDHPSIELPTPRISYSISNSVDYETFKNTNYSDGNMPETVVLGVDEKGYATDYSTTYGTKTSFEPTETGSYKISYTTRVRTYKTAVFEYVEEEDSDDLYALDDYFVEVEEEYKAEGLKIKIEEENLFRVYAPDSGGLTYTEFTVGLNANKDKVDITKIIGTTETLSNVDLARFNHWKDNLKIYPWTSDTLLVNVIDEKGPTIKKYDYIEAIPSTSLEQENEKGETVGYKLDVYGIDAEDASGIDFEKSSVVVTRTYKVNGSTRTSRDTLNLTDRINGKTFEITQNGTVTIAYTVYDNKGNSSTAEYVIRAGDNTDPVIRVDSADESDFIATSYSLSDFEKGQFVIDLSKLNISDDKTLKEDLKITYELVNDSTEDTIMEPVDETENSLTYNIEEVGNYTFSVTVTDEAQNSITREFKFEVTEETQDPTITYKVIGTVLIVISVLLLAGVIIYFIVSKVKLDKELKK